ncbi:MAG: class I SAM-dependent methyltransferase [Gammaproteobacteria bacterium]|nr:class I SAM-dependent methyltransferase [Gammaproteobacteria bacterium]
MNKFEPLTAEELDEVFEIKYGAANELGQTPSLYARWDYHSPDDFYEAAIVRLVDNETSWADVGCGHMLFPSNPNLARQLADRCRRLVGIDPDETIENNPYVHESFRVLMDDYEPQETFDLITLRMVAEHVENPEQLLRTLVAATHPGSTVLIYTVNGISPIPVLTRLTSMGVRHRIKKILWGTEEKDTFPTAYRMNSRRDLREMFTDAGFDEAGFYYLDDCRTFTRFPALQTVELATRKLCRTIGFAYPENCLLGIYRRRN